MKDKRKSISKIYLDMDGVLADFNRGVRELCGFEAPDQSEKRTAEEESRMWADIGKVDHFYGKLEMMPGAKVLFDTIWNAYGNRCEILTGIPRPERSLRTAGDDKKEWVKRLLSPDVKVNICFRAEKIERCTGPETILIDDLDRTILEWRKKGGTGILHETAEKTLAELRNMGVLEK